MPEYQPFNPELREQMMKLARLMFHEVMPRFNALANEPNLCPEEKMELEELSDLIARTQPTLIRMKEMLTQHLFAFSQEVYLDAKIKAEKGHVDSKKFYEVLKPSYKAMMMEQLKRSQN
jgi:hypothetical protein